MSACIESLEKEINRKIALAERIGKQMAADVVAGVLTAETTGFHHTATESLKAAQLKFEANDFSGAIFLFSRGCVNLGQFNVCKDRDRALAALAANEEETAKKAVLSTVNETLKESHASK